MKLPLPVVFAVMTALFWGLYGPVLGWSRADLKSPFKPYLLIGLAYLIWGIGGGLIGMLYKGDNFSFPPAGLKWGFIAGTLGAFGALTLTLAMYNKGEPYIVMPIVFGGAVTVSALVSLASAQHVNPLLYVGIVGVLASTVLVAANTPHAPAGPPPAGGAAHAPAASEAPAPSGHK